MIFQMTSSRELTIQLAKGLHLVPCSRIVALAGNYNGEVKIHWNEVHADAKSIFDLMTLAAPQGSVVLVEATGDDADAFLDAMEQLFARDFEA